MFGKHKKVKDTKGAQPKPLMILATNPDIAAAQAQLDAIAKDANDKIGELQKMALQAAKASNDRSETVWAEIEAKVKPLLPADYSRDKYTLAFDAGVLFLVTDSDKCTCLLCTLGLS